MIVCAQRIDNTSLLIFEYQQKRVTPLLLPGFVTDSLFGSPALIPVLGQLERRQASTTGAFKAPWELQLLLFSI